MQKRKDPKGRVLKDGESYRKSDNRYSFRYTTLGGKRNTIYAKTLEELREKEREIQKDLLAGIVPNKIPTLNELFEMWRNSKSTIRESTRRSYIFSYRSYIAEELGDLKVNSIRKSDIKTFYINLHEEKNIGWGSINIVQNILNKVFEFAIDDQIVKSNPVKNILKECRRAYGYQPTKRKALTISEQNAFIDFINNAPRYKHWVPFFTFMLATGCRISEIVGLRWQDIDMEKGYIDINHGISYFKKDTSDKAEYILTKTTKTQAGIRTIPMLSEVKKALIKEKENQLERGISCKQEIDSYTDFVFLNRNGYIHTQAGVNDVIRRIVRQHNLQEEEKAKKEKREPLYLPKISCHIFRHTFATRYCENERNLKVIQYILGHGDISTTMNIYADATRDEMSRSFKELETKIRVS